MDSASLKRNVGTVISVVNMCRLSLEFGSSLETFIMLSTIVEQAQSSAPPSPPAKGWYLEAAKKHCTIQFLDRPNKSPAITPFLAS